MTTRPDSPRTPCSQFTPNRRRGQISSAVPALIVLALASFAFADEPRTLADNEFFTKGSYIAYAAPWSTYFGAGTAMKQGIDYADEITVRSDSFPANVEFSWHWPLTPPKHTGVYGYNAVSYGSYDGGVPEVRIAPLQVKNMRELAETFRCEWPRPIGDFNVLSELFLTKTPGGEKVGEVGFFLRAAKSAISFADAGEQLGTFTDAAGRAWKVAKQPAPHGPFYMFLPTGEVLAGTVDFRAAIEFLRSRGHVTGEEWVNGVAFGIEPIAGSGSLRLESLAIRYQ